MMYIDPRAGSKDLITDLGDGKYRLKDTMLPCTPITLTSGDVAFIGNGPNNTLVPVGIEYKKLNDLLQCMCNGRFTGTQLPGLQEDYRYYFLLVEGQWKGDPKTGLLMTEWQNRWSHRTQWVECQVGNRRFTALELNSWLTTMQVVGGVRVLQSSNIDGTIQVISALYSWWTSKEYDEHRAHLHPDNSGSVTKLLRRPTTQKERSRLLTEMMASKIESIGLDKSKLVADHFRTPRRMVNATAKDWEMIKGIGNVISSRTIRDFIGDEE